jgi:hypothetical protein
VRQLCNETRAFGGSMVQAFTVSFPTFFRALGQDA